MGRVGGRDSFSRFVKPFFVFGGIYGVQTSGTYQFEDALHPTAVYFEGFRALTHGLGKQDGRPRRPGPIFFLVLKQIEQISGGGFGFQGPSPAEKKQPEVHKRLKTFHNYGR